MRACCGQSKCRKALVLGFTIWLATTLLLVRLQHHSSSSQPLPGDEHLLLDQRHNLPTASRATSFFGSTNSSSLPRPASQSANLNNATAVLLLGCNRPSAVRRSLAQLLNRRPPGWASAYPVFVSLDCGHRSTQAVVDSFASRLAGRLRQPDLRPIRVPPRERRLVGYYRIARHFRWALDQIFVVLNYSSAIIVEDDLDIAPDFYAYFRHLSPLLSRDPTVWCVSAWNDNGKPGLIDARRSDLFHRTDFFPGLGWMLLRPTWLELRQSWPRAYWDDHLRKAEIRRNRSCIRPEVSRTYTFGQVGVSHGQHFHKFLRHIALNNDSSLNYSSLSLDYLTKARYDNFTQSVYRLPLAANVHAALSMSTTTSTGLSIAGIRIEYWSRQSYLNSARRLGLMADFKHGVPRCAYRGVVPLFKAGRWLYLAPRLPWRGYDAKWK